MPKFSCISFPRSHLFAVILSTTIYNQNLPNKCFQKFVLNHVGLSVTIFCNCHHCHRILAPCEERLWAVVVAQLVASDTRGPLFEFSHRQTFISEIYLVTINCIEKTKIKKKTPGREPWSSGYGWRLMFDRSWVQIQPHIMDGHFFALICCKNCIVFFEKTKNKQKEAGVGPLKKEKRKRGREWPFSFLLTVS